MRGFTLLEMILTTALLAMLMIGVLGVIAGIGPASGAAATIDPAGSPTPQVVDAFARILADDLTQAKTIKTSENTIELNGLIALSNARSSMHRPAKVQYVFENIAGEQWLVRRQSILDIPTNQNEQVDLVCRGVDYLSLISTASSDESVVDLWRLKLWMNQSDSPVIERLIVAPRKELP